MKKKIIKNKFNDLKNLKIYLNNIPIKYLIALSIPAFSQIINFSTAYYISRIMGFSYGEVGILVAILSSSFFVSDFGCSTYVSLLKSTKAAFIIYKRALFSRFVIFLFLSSAILVVFLIRNQLNSTNFIFSIIGLLLHSIMMANPWPLFLQRRKLIIANFSQYIHVLIYALLSLIIYNSPVFLLLKLYLNPSVIGYLIFVSAIFISQLIWQFIIYKSSYRIYSLFCIKNLENIFIFKESSYRNIKNIILLLPKFLNSFIKPLKLFLKLGASFLILGVAPFIYDAFAFDMSKDFLTIYVSGVQILAFLGFASRSIIMLKISGNNKLPKPKLSTYIYLILIGSLIILFYCFFIDKLFNFEEINVRKVGIPLISISLISQLVGAYILYYFISTKQQKIFAKTSISSVFLGISILIIFVLLGIEYASLLARTFESVGALLIAIHWTNKKISTKNLEI